MKVLFRRSDEATLKLALDIAEQVNNQDLYKAVLVRYNAFKNGQQKETKEGDNEKEEKTDLDSVHKQENTKDDAGGEEGKSDCVHKPEEMKDGESEEQKTELDNVQGQEKIKDVEAKGEKTELDNISSSVETKVGE